jgi:hypothetical protein
MHGGRIWAENRSEGGGRFCVELPGIPECLRPGHEAPAAEAPEAEAPRAAVASGAPRVDAWNATGVLPPLERTAPRSNDGPRPAGELPPIR